MMGRGPTYSDEELLSHLRALGQKLGRTPRKRDMNDYGDHSARTYQDRFGSWSAAVETVGFEPNDVGSAYHERPDACPLCGVEQTGLDYHHWRYGDNEIGCYLCRDCHDAIHDGDANTQNVGWLVPCIANLVARHLEHHDGVPDVDVILDRYNLPDVGDVVAMELEKHAD